MISTNVGPNCSNYSTIWIVRTDEWYSIFFYLYMIIIYTYVYVSKSPLFMASRIHSVIFTMSVLRAATGKDLVSTKRTHYLHLNIKIHMMIIMFSYLPIDEGSDPCAIFLIETAPLTWFILTSENKFVIKMCNVIKWCQNSTAFNVRKSNLQTFFSHFPCLQAVL